MQTNIVVYENQDIKKAKLIEEKNAFRANYKSSKELYVRPAYEHLKSKLKFQFFTIIFWF